MQAQKILMRALIACGFSVQIWAAFFPVFAESEQTLTLEQAIAVAMANNPRLKAAEFQLEIAEAQKTTAGTRMNPALMSDNGVAEKTYRLGITQTMELGGKRRKRAAVAESQRQSVASDIQTTRLDLRSDVRRAYTELYNAIERQKTLEYTVKVVQELSSIAKKREQAGDISELDVLQTDISRLNTENDAQSAQVEIANTTARLNALMNQSIHAPLRLTAPNTAPQLTTSGAPSAPTAPGALQGRVVEMDLDVNRLIDQALAQRPELRKNAADIEASRRQETLARANRIPNLQLIIGPDYVSEPGQQEISVFGTLNLDLPIFNRQQGPIREALAQQSQLAQTQTSLRNQIALEVITAYNTFRMNQDRIKRYETEILPLASRVTYKSQLAFKEGKTAVLTPLLAQTAYMNTRMEYLQTLLDYQNAISDLERAVGTGL